jgi:hypothetical protein
MAGTRVNRRQNPVVTKGARLLAKWRGDRTLFAAATLLRNAGAERIDPSRVLLIERGQAKPDIALGLVMRECCAIPIETWEQPIARTAAKRCAS